MKRSFVILILLTAITSFSNAQFFVEGSVGAGYNSGQSMFWDVFETPSNFFFNVSPLAGYHLTDKIAVGAKVSLVRIKQKTMELDQDTGDKVPLERRAPEWGCAVFVRYQLLGSKKIAFLVESSAYISEIKIIDNSTLSSVYQDVGVRMLPFVTYDLSDKWSIKITGDFLRLDYSSRTSTDKDTGFDVKLNRFGFTGQSTLFNRVPDIRIGFIYHFNKSSL